MGSPEAAQVDCSRVLERVPGHTKALFRRAQAEVALKVRSPMAPMTHPLTLHSVAPLHVAHMQCPLMRRGMASLVLEDLLKHVAVGSVQCTAMTNHLLFERICRKSCALVFDAESFLQWAVPEAFPCRAAGAEPFHDGTEACELAAALQVC